MHKSWFSYNITKPYPFRWFTPVALSGGVILAALFSILNLAGNGYQLKSIYTIDPNTTSSAQKRWFMKEPFRLGGGLDPKCEPQLLSIGNQLFTSNLGLSYEVTAIWRREGNDTGPVTHLPSVSYLNNILENCLTESVILDLHKNDFVMPSNAWWISWSPSSSAVATAHCTVMSDSAPTNITLQARYSGTGDEVYSYVISDNYTTYSSVWWGTRLLNAYWSGILTTMSKANLSSAVEDNDSFWIGANFNYGWSYGENKSIRDLDFFTLNYYLIASNGGIVNPGWDGAQNVAITPYPVALYNNQTISFSGALTEGLHFAKVMHSLVAIDLGNKNLPILLLNDDDLQYALNAPDDMNRQLPNGVLNVTNPNPYQYFAQIPWPGVPPPRQPDKLLLNESYDAFSPLIGKLGTTDATIFT